MLKYIPINSQSKDLHIIEDLYIKSFPENERSPFHLLLDDTTKCSEIFALYDKNIFCGFISLLTYKDISHIIYLAINKSKRNTGYGSKLLRLLNSLKPNHRIIADIESPNENCENKTQRIKRKQFYINNNFITSNVKYNWRGETYEILINNGKISDKEFWNFWEEIVKINPEFSKF